jgi:hypothetical protein
MRLVRKSLVSGRAPARSNSSNFGGGAFLFLRVKLREAFELTASPTALSPNGSTFSLSLDFFPLLKTFMMAVLAESRVGRDAADHCPTPYNDLCVLEG